MTLVSTLSLAFAVGCGCGGKKKDPKEGGGDQPQDAAHEQAATKATSRIAAWLGEAASARVSAMGKEFGRQLGQKLSNDPDVLRKFQDLASAVLADKKAKQELKSIEDKATEGFSTRITGTRAGPSQPAGTRTAPARVRSIRGA